MNDDYKKREIDHMIADVNDKLALILKQTTLHNGRLTRVEKILLVVGCVTGTLLIVNGSRVFELLKAVFL